GVKTERTLVCSWLTVLAKPSRKRRSACPCGSGKTTEHCHQEELRALRRRVPSNLAERMLLNLRQYDRGDQRIRMRLEAIIDATLPSRSRPSKGIIPASQSALKLSSSFPN